MYGIVTGEIDPVARDFSFIVVIVGGTGSHEGFIGSGDFTGTLTDEAEYIEGDLLLVLSNSESEQPRKLPNREDNDNPALSLLD